MADAWSAFGSVLGGIAALIAVGIANKQLRNLVRTIRQDVVLLTLQIEAELNDRKTKMTEAALEVKFVATEIKDFEEDKEFKSAKEARRRLERANGMLDLTKENYLNAADRLCHSILKGGLFARPRLAI